MTKYTEKLSAFLDGELPQSETDEINQAIANDPALQDELASLIAADDAAKIEFSALLDEPVPFKLADIIQNAPLETTANSPKAPSHFGWVTAGITAVALLFGGTLGYWGGVSQQVEVTVARGWLNDIADYHSVYANQKRHLVEVAASDADHIQKWLTKTVGTDVRIPDLTQQGLQFQGARLLVAAGKPVAQLMYTDADMNIIALCLLQSNKSPQDFAERRINGFDMVTWGSGNANFVIIGDKNREDLNQIAQAAATQI